MSYDPCACNTTTHSFNWFNIDGLPCEPCSDTFVCKYHFPAKCVIVSVALPNIGSAANDNVEHILQLIDTLIGSAMNITFAGVDSSTIHWTAGGAAGHTPTAAVKISADAGNTAVAHSDGIYVPTPSNTDTYMVKVDSGDTPAFLESQVVGASDTDNLITIQVTKVSGQMQFKPVINLDALAAAICTRCNTDIHPEVAVTCGDIDVFGTFTLNAPTNGILQIPVTVTGSGQVTITVTAGNGSFFGSVTQTIGVGTTIITVPLFYNGFGSDGTQTLTVSFTGTDNVLEPCLIEIDVDPAVAGCVPVTIVGSPNLPDAIVGVPYNYTIYLNGTAPFALNTIVKPGWMTIAISGGSVVFGGTADSDNIGTANVSFNVTNCTSDTVHFADTVDVINEDSSIFNNTPLDFNTYDIYVDGNLVQSDSLDATLTDTFTYGDLLSNVDVLVVINYGSPVTNPFDSASITSGGSPVAGTFNTNGTVITFSNVDIAGGINIVVVGTTDPTCTLYQVNPTPTVSIEWENCADATPLSTTVSSPIIVCSRTGQLNITSGSAVITPLGVCT